MALKFLFFRQFFKFSQLNQKNLIFYNEYKEKVVSIKVEFITHNTIEGSGILAI